MSFSLSKVDGSFSKDTSEPIWEGYLLKQGGTRGGFRNWKRRWFRLDTENLCYYKQKPGSNSDSKGSDDNAEPVLGLLPIRNSTIIDIQGPDDQTVKALEVPPIWDIGATGCHDCKKEFSAILKRRFCRSCGHAYCMLCSPRAIILTKLGYGDPVRVCSFCFNGVTSVGTFRAATTSPLDDNIITQVMEQKKGFEWRTKKNAFILNSAEVQLSFQAETATSKLEFLIAIRSVVIYHRQDTKSDSAKPAQSPSQSKSKHLDRQISASSQWNIDFKAIKILHEVQDGTSGKVYKGRLWGTDVAVKTISDVSMVDDLQKEVAILSQLRHPNVVLYIGACLDPQNVAVVTEWCERGSLFDLLYDESPGCVNLDFQTIVSIAIGIAQGMNYLHSLNHKIIHRDLKSQHILIDSHFTPKVADFGLSKVKRGSIADKGDNKIGTGSLAIGYQKITKPHNESKVKSYNPNAAKEDLHVSVEWTAPEVMEGAPYNQSVDIYSFGIVLSELLSRQLPFRDRYNIFGHADVLEAVLEYGAIPTIPDWCGAKMQKIVSDCMNRNPESRPTFNEIILRLRSFYPLEPADVFHKFDVPRLVFMMSSRNRTQQFRAARELADMSRDLSETCHACGRTPLAYSLIDDATMVKFVTRLNSLLASEDDATLLHAMIALRAMIDHYKAPLRSKLVSIIRQDQGVQQLALYIKSQNSDISKAAAQLLSRTMDATDAVNNLENIGQSGSEILNELLNIAQHEIGELEKQIKVCDDALSKKSSLSSWISNRLRQNDVQGLDPHPTLQSVLTPRTVISNSPNVPEPVVKPKEVLSFENRNLPPQLQVEMAQGAQCWGWLGLLDASGEQWMDVYGVLRNAAIYIFDSEESRPDAVRFIIRIKVGNVTAKFRSGRKRGRQNCLQIALSSELLPVSTDPRSPAMKRIFINLGSPQRFAFWVQNINEHLEIPIPLTEMEDGVEVN